MRPGVSHSAAVARPDSPVGGVRPPGAVAYLLINPPLTDPTCPYHSIPYLVASARELGFTGYRCLDANVAALNYLAEPDQVTTLLATARSERFRIERVTRLSRADEFRYLLALSAAGLEPGFMQVALDVFRDPGRFHHYPTYRQAVMATYRWIGLLSLNAPPALLHTFQLRPNGPVNHMSLADLTSEGVIDATCGPFLPYLEGPYLALLGEKDWEVIGFSVNYTSQLLLALRMARMARQACPDSLIVFGGTEVCDDVKFARNVGDVWKLFPDADVLVPGEGESPFCEILGAVRDFRFPGDVKGVMTRYSGHLLGLNYEDLSRLPTPAYDVWDWADYWAPEPVLLYSPTRGCYWNRCTFCDYGLNMDSPTSPARERPVGNVMADLTVMAPIGRTVYFAVDTMSPRYLRTLASDLAKRPGQVRWSCELRLERTFPRRGIAGLLAQAGCAAVSFGYESGSQRILDLIDKGVNLGDVVSILEDLRRHNIAVQLMGFTGFPTETPAEADETYKFLIRHRDLWALADIGYFTLTPGALVARDPGRFGVTLHPLPRSDDLARFLPWKEGEGKLVHWPEEPVNRVRPELASAIRRSADSRPFVGGIDSAHSLLYFARYGGSLRLANLSGDPAVRIVAEALCDVPFKDLADFVGPGDVERKHSQLHRGDVDMSYQEMTRWLEEPGRAERGRSAAAVLSTGAVAALPTGADLSPGGVVARLLPVLSDVGGAP